MKGDNFVTGVSIIDFSMINLGKRVWSESLSESDSGCGRFSCAFFFTGFWFASIRNFAKFTDCAPHPPRNPMKGNAQGGNPFALANQGYSVTLRKQTSNLESRGFHSQVYCSPRDKRGKHRSFFSMIDLAATAFCFRTLQKSFAGFRKRVWHNQPIDRIDWLIDPVLKHHGSPPTANRCPLWEGLTSLLRCSWCILQSQTTGWTS